MAAAESRRIQWQDFFRAFKWSEKSYDCLSVFLIFGLLFLFVGTYGHYGNSLDENFQKTYGEAIVKYYSSRFKDRSAFSYHDLYYYGGLYDTVATLFTRLVRLGEYESRHLFNSLVSLLSLLGCWKVARLLGGPIAGFWALILLLLSPAYYGHMFNNPKDIPFAAGYIWSLYFLLVSIKSLPRIPHTLSVKLGIGIGVTLGVRIGGLIILCYLILIVGLWLIFRLIRERLPRFFRRNLLPLVIALVIIGLLALTFMLIAWPWAQESPIKRPFEALQRMTHFKWGGTTLFQGLLYRADQIPWTYLPIYILIKLPEATLLILGLGIFLGIASLLRSYRFLNHRVLAQKLLLLFSVLFPVSYSIFRRSAIYDEMRHFLFIVPPLTALGGVLLARWFYCLKRQQRFFHYLLLAILIGYGIYQAVLMVYLHPYQYIYYNQFVGGIPGANGRFEMDYWAHSYRESIGWLQGYLEKKHGPRQFLKKRFKVETCGAYEVAIYFFRPNVHFYRVPQADYLVAYTRANCDRRVEGPPLFAVQRFKVTLSLVKELPRRRFQRGMGPANKRQLTPRAKKLLQGK